VRGISDDFWATFVDPEPGNPKKRVMTVWGQGAINVNTANPQTLLAVVCSAAVRPAPICDDPMQQQTFLMMLGLIKGFTAGAPMFGNGNDFIKTMQGGGLLGPMLLAIGVQPVQFMSPAEAAKMLTTESKVFSIYSDGVVKGFRRETRVRVRAVVDFRSAPPPGFAPMYGSSPMGSGSAMAGQFGAVPAVPGMMPTAGPTGGQFGATPPAGANPNGIMGALLPNPAGTIIYFRIE
jgi:general secretion pathway protein K